MDGIEGVVSSKLALENMKLATSVQVGLLKKQLDLQEEMMRLLLQSMGIGVSFDATA